MTALKIADLQRDAYTEGREEGIFLGHEGGIRKLQFVGFLKGLQRVVSRCNCCTGKFLSEYDSFLHDS